MKIKNQDWQWFGNAGHFILGAFCRFHLCTKVGDKIISTVGELFHDAPIREDLAKARGVALEGKGDARIADYLQKIGYDDLGYNRKYETMVFNTTGGVCSCGCGMPVIADFAELDGEGYNSAAEATEGHMRYCEKWS